MPPILFFSLVFADKRVTQSAKPIDLHPSAKIRFLISINYAKSDCEQSAKGRGFTCPKTRLTRAIKTK